MESVETWMWLIASLILGGLLLTGAYGMLSYYTQNVETRHAQEGFQNLLSSADRACQTGIGTTEIKDYVFPYIVTDISVSNESGSPRELCIQLRDEVPYCYMLKVCNITLVPDHIALSQKTGFFHMVQSLSGKGKAANLRFTVKKVAYGDISITWEETLNKG